MTLSPKFKQQLKAEAHHLNPIISIGNRGYSAAVQAEIERALDDHELIKIKIAGEDRDERKKLTEELCKFHQAELVQAIGKIIVIYRKFLKK